MLKAVLIDIDNTLLLYDENKVLKKIIFQMHTHFKDLFKFEDFKDRFIFALLDLKNCAGSRLNKDYFISSFLKDFKISTDIVWDRLLDFFYQDYYKFKENITPVTGVKKIFNELKKMKLKIVLASQPAYPLKTQLDRLSWMNIGTESFDYVTHFENTYYAKPHLNYYISISQSINVKPEHCIMIGDDRYNDIIASKTGMKTFLAIDKIDLGYTSFLENDTTTTSSQNSISPHYTGRFSNVLQTIQTLM